jgi:hypothetical protein
MNNCILLFISFGFFTVSNAHATDMTSLVLDNDLAEGKTIAIGKIIEEKDGNPYFACVSSGRSLL